MPGQETLSSQLQRGKVDAYLLTQGIEQAGKVNYRSLGSKAKQVESRILGYTGHIEYTNIRLGFCLQVDHCFYQGVDWVRDTSSSDQLKFGAPQIHAIPPWL